MGRGGGGVGNNQFATFDAESKSAKILKSHYWGGGGGVSENKFPTLDAESKSDKIPKSHYSGGEGKIQWPIPNCWCWIQIC